MHFVCLLCSAPSAALLECHMGAKGRGAKRAQRTELEFDIQKGEVSLIQGGMSAAGGACARWNSQSERWSCEQNEE